jgi:hypothetical protein
MLKPSDAQFSLDIDSASFRYLSFTIEKPKLLVLKFIVPNDKLASCLFFLKDMIFHVTFAIAMFHVTSAKQGNSSSSVSGLSLDMSPAAMK